jgi:hypothetical protein
MRLLSCFAILFFFLNRQIVAQEARDTANPKARPATFAPYRFPAFAQGMVFLRNKDTVSISLNYNVIRNEMQFINEQGDTLKLKDPLTVTKIFINEEEFYYNKEKWVQKIETKAGVVPGYWTKVLVELKVNKPDFADYDQRERKVWMEGYSNFDVHTKDFYFFGDGYGNFIKATRSSLLAYFEKQAPLIKRYLNTHPADFNKLSDIRQVLQFCDTLN